MRIVEMYDEDNKIQITFWRDQSNNVSFKVGDTIILKNLMVNEYRGKKLGTLNDTEIIIEIPHIKRYSEILDFKLSSPSPNLLPSLSEDKTGITTTKIFSLSEISKGAQTNLIEEG